MEAQYRIDRWTADDGLPQNSVYGIVQTRDGYLWLATLDGLARFDGVRFTVFNKSNSAGIVNNRFVSLFETGNGDLWAGTETSGAGRFRGGRFEHFSAEQTGVPRIVYWIVADADEDAAVLLDDNFQAFRFSDGKFSLFETRLNPSAREQISRHASVKIPCRPDSENRFSECLIDGQWIDFSPGDNLPQMSFVRAAQETASGMVWLITADGRLARAENGRITGIFDERDGLPKRPLYFVTGARLALAAGDADGALWLVDLPAMRKELLLKKNAAAAAALDKAEILSTYQDGEGNLWFGNRRDGLFRARKQVVTAYSEADGIRDKNVYPIYEDRAGTLWIGSYDGGLARFKDGKFTRYDTKTGLPNDGAFQILEDENRNFWISSNRGIYRVNKDELNDFADGKISRVNSIAYGKADGMLNAECNGGRSPAGIRARDGRLWFPTQDGAAVIDPQAVTANPKPPPVVIETIKIDNVLIAECELRTVNCGFDREKSVINIAPDQQSFEISYTALSFINSENLRFKYKLENLDTDWVDAGTRRTAYFSHVPPGEYTFRVIAANSDNVWNERGAAIEIVVRPAFYQTWWFLIASAAAIGLFAFGIYRRRLSESRRRQFAQEEFSRRLINAHETERRRVAAELHDSIGQSLAMIKNSAVFGANTANDLSEAKEQLREISGASAQAISEVREIAYNLRPYLVDRLGLTKAIGELLEKIEDNSALEIVDELEDIDDLFEKEAEISIYRIIQESLNNILKHSEATKARVSIVETERSVKIEIADNGKGFDATSASETDKRGGFGLLGMSERVRMLGGTLAIESAVNKGAQIKIELWKRKLKS